MPNLYVEFEGAPTRIDHLLWVGEAPCGCWDRAMHVQADAITADQVKLDFADGSRLVAEADKHTYLLIRRGDPRYMEKMTGRCPHREPLVLPEGHVWAYAGSSRTGHVVPVNEGWTLPTYDALALCRVKVKRWNVDPWRQIVKCTKCIAEMGARP